MSTQPSHAPNIVNLLLRSDIRVEGDNGELAYVSARYEDIDLDELTPRARALAETIAQQSLRTRGPIRCQHRTATKRDMTPNPEIWLHPDEMDQPYQQTWSGWSKFPATSTMTGAEYLEQQARRIPPEFAIVSAAGCRTLVPSMEAGAADDALTLSAVMEYLARRGRHIMPGTWRSYVARDQAPAPVRQVGRTPLWALADVKAWLDGTWKPAEK